MTIASFVIKPVQVVRVALDGNEEAVRVFAGAAAARIEPAWVAS